MSNSSWVNCLASDWITPSTTTAIGASPLRTCDKPRMVMNEVPTDCDSASDRLGVMATKSLALRMPASSMALPVKALTLIGTLCRVSSRPRARMVMTWVPSASAAGAGVLAAPGALAGAGVVCAITAQDCNAEAMASAIAAGLMSSQWDLITTSPGGLGS